MLKTLWTAFICSLAIPSVASAQTFPADVWREIVNSSSFSALRLLYQTSHQYQQMVQDRITGSEMTFEESVQLAKLIEDLKTASNAHIAISVLESMDCLVTESNRWWDFTLASQYASMGDTTQKAYRLNENAQKLKSSRITKRVQFTRAIFRKELEMSFEKLISRTFQQLKKDFFRKNSTPWMEVAYFIERMVRSPLLTSSALPYLFRLSSLLEIDKNDPNLHVTLFNRVKVIELLGQDPRLPTEMIPVLFGELRPYLDGEMKIRFGSMIDPAIEALALLVKGNGHKINSNVFPEMTAELEKRALHGAQELGSDFIHAQAVASFLYQLLKQGFPFDHSGFLKIFNGALSITYEPTVQGSQPEILDFRMKLIQALVSWPHITNDQTDYILKHIPTDEEDSVKKLINEKMWN